MATPAPAEVRALYDLHGPALHRTLRRLAAPGVDAADLLQDVFVVALRRADDLLVAESPRAWLFGIALKVASDSRRRAFTRRLFGLLPPPLPAGPADPHGDLERAQRAAMVQRALNKLSAKKRDVLVLYELEGLTGEEIAAAVDAPLKTVWTRLHHARRELSARVTRLQGKDP